MTDWYSGSREQIFGHTTFSQHGEDLFLLNLFTLMRIGKPTYLDLGAHKPWTISNTALFYCRGSRGVLVEANPNLTRELQYERFGDIVVNAGVAAQHGKMPYGKMPFYMHSPDAGRNTFDPKERDRLIAEGHPVTEEKMIGMMTINQIVDEYCGGVWPDLLCTDVEGLDCEILLSGEFGSKDVYLLSGDSYGHRNVGPKVICSEINQEDAQAMKAVLFTRGYHFLCRIMSNLIFVRQDFVNEVLV